MADDVCAIIQEIIDLTGLKEVALAKKFGVSQATLNRWRNSVHVPNKKQWDRVMLLWREVKGIRMSLDQKLSAYDAATQLTVHQMVDNYLRNLPSPRSR